MATNLNRTLHLTVIHPPNMKFTKMTATLIPWTEICQIFQLRSHIYFSLHCFYVFIGVLKFKKLVKSINVLKLYLCMCMIAFLLLDEISIGLITILKFSTTQWYTTCSLCNICLYACLCILLIYIIRRFMCLCL